MTKNVIIITGSSGYLGKSLVTHFSKQYHVIGFDKIVKKNQEIYKFYKTDLTNPISVKNSFKLIKEENYSILINCAGKIQNKLIYNIFEKNKRHDFRTWCDIVESNLNSTFLCSSHFIENLIEKRKKGLIINVSSISAKGILGQSAYSSAKAAVEVLSKIWAEELSTFGIRCVNIAPGYFNVPSTHNNLNEKIIKKILNNTGVKRLGNVKEFVETVDFVVKNNFINGKTISVDGGLFL